jgi:hypothetical protein
MIAIAVQLIVAAVALMGPLSFGGNVFHQNTTTVIARFMRATQFVCGGEKNGLPGQAGQ